jgi:hypothetical protein
LNSLSICITEENFAFKNHSRNLSKSAFIQQQQEQQPPFSPPSYIPKDPPNVDTPTQQAIAQYKQGTQNNSYFTLDSSDKLLHF